MAEVMLNCTRDPSSAPAFHIEFVYSRQVVTIKVNIKQKKSCCDFSKELTRVEFLELLFSITEVHQAQNTFVEDC
jgi:hypothetical protein